MPTRSRRIMYLSIDDRNLGKMRFFLKGGKLHRKWHIHAELGILRPLPIFDIAWKVQKLQCQRYIVGKMRSLKTGALTLTTGLQDPATIFPKWAEMVQKIAYLRGNNAFQRNI